MPGPATPAPQTVALWSSSGDQLGDRNLLGQRDGLADSDTGLAGTITAGQTYTASYRAPAGHYAVTSGSFSEPYTNGPLTVPAGGGTYRYPNGFPSASSNANYWVDVVVII